MFKYLTIVSLYLIIEIVTLHADPLSDGDLAIITSEFNTYLNNSGYNIPAPGWELEGFKISTEFTEDETSLDFDRRPIYHARIRLNSPYKSHVNTAKGWKEINNEILNQYGFTLNEILFLKLVHFLNANIVDVEFNIFAPCVNWIIFGYKGKVTQEGSICLSMSTERYIQPNQNIQTIAASAKNIENKLLTKEKIKEYIERRFKSNESLIRWINYEDSYIEVKISNIKGQVFQNSNRWECLQFSIFYYIEENKGWKIRAVLDGSTATSLGIPKESEYETRMDIESGTDVRNYLQSFLIDLELAL